MLCWVNARNYCDQFLVHIAHVYLSVSVCVGDLGEGAVLTEPLGSWKGEGGTLPWMGRK